MSLLFALPIIVVLSEHMIIDIYFKTQITENQYTWYDKLPQIYGDLETLDANPIFPKLTTNNNAEYLISRYVPFNGFDKLISSNPQYDSLKKINVEYADWRRNTETFTTMLNDKSIMSLNSSWVGLLSQFDHWNFSSNTQIKEYLSLVPNVNSLTRLDIFSRLPIPNYNMMRSWALLYVFHSYKNNRSLDGLKLHRKVAELINSSGTIMGNMAAASMLKDEYALMSYLNVKNWQTKPYHYIDIYTRVSWAWLGVLKLPLFGRLPLKFVQFIKPQNGACASSWENASTYSVYLDFFQPRVAFESDFSKNIKFTSELYKNIQTQCNLQSYSPFISRSPASIDLSTSYKVDEVIYSHHGNKEYNYSLQDNWMYWPFVRRLIGLMSFGTPGPIDYLSHYKAKKKKFAGQNFVTDN